MQIDASAAQLVLLLLLLPTDPRTHRRPLTGVLLLLVLGPVLLCDQRWTAPRAKGELAVAKEHINAKEELVSRRFPRIVLPLPLEPLWLPLNAPQAYRAPFQLYASPPRLVHTYVRITFRNASAKLRRWMQGSECEGKP